MRVILRTTCPAVDTDLLISGFIKIYQRARRQNTFPLATPRVQE